MKKRHILVAVLGAVLILSLVSSSALALDIIGYRQKVSVYADWEEENDWLIVETYADGVGERYNHISDPNDTVQVAQGWTFGYSYGETRWAWYTYYIPGSRQHELTIRVFTSPSPVRFTNPFGYDNAQSQTPPPEIGYALDTLWNFVVSFVGLPFPSPWGLLRHEDGETITITMDSDLKGGSFRYKAEPDLGGADWIWHVYKPVKTGWYLMDLWTYCEAGTYYYSWGGRALSRKLTFIYILCPFSRFTWGKQG